ncbi:MAG: hypothetical protein IPJ16_11610 [Bacteroidales bacterium]|nr:hypothetical protein [Bacteroidales bacterium]
MRSILYLWDSFSKYSWENRIRLFDKIFTFDIYDSLKYNIEYLPNFYFNVTDSQKNEIVNDLSFIGKFSPERLLIIDRLVPHISEKNIKYFFLLRPSFKMSFHNYYFYRLLKYLKINNRWVINYISIFEANSMILKRNFIKSDNLSFEEAQKTMQNSNVILDLPYSDQTGYTHRIIAALANGKKILTTNPGIVNESFFNQDQIHILNPDKPEIDIKWIKEKVGFCVNPYFNKLELKSWLNHILNGMVA